MKKIILLALISSSAFALELPIVKVKDGDTIATKINTMPTGLQDFAVRVRGIDTPEKGFRAKCPQEASLAESATAMTKSIVKNHTTMTVTNCNHDKYGGRIVCDVNIGQVNVGKELIANNLARPYDGGKKGSWCNGK